MQIILSILQFLGIALLVVLGILLVLLLLIVFYPICYTIEGELYSEKNAKANVSWLFHLIRVHVRYKDEAISAKIGIFWKNIPFSYELKSKEPSKNEDEPDIGIEQESSESSITDNDVTDFETEIEKEENSHTESEREVQERNWKETSQSKVADVTAQEEDSLSKPQIKPQKDEFNQVFKDSSDSKIKSGKRIKKGKKKRKKEKINIIEKIKSMILKIKGTLNKITQIWMEIKILITDECNQLAVAHIKKESIALLKSFLPKKSNVEGIFSLGSPDKTGKVFGLLCAFPFMYQNKWRVRPDFETEHIYFEGRFYIKGRIYVYKMIGMVLRILLDKNCRRLYKRIKQFGNKIKTYS